VLPVSNRFLVFPGEHNASYRSDPGLIISPSGNVDIGGHCICVRPSECSLNPDVISTDNGLSPALTHRTSPISGSYRQGMNVTKEQLANTGDGAVVNILHWVVGSCTDPKENNIS
jgi:hypothetical protein